MRTFGYLVFFAVLAAALTLQSTVLDGLGLPWAAPDLVLVVAAAFGLVCGETPGMVLGFALGLTADLIPPAAHAIGREAFVLCLVGHLAGRTAVVIRGSALRQLAVVGLLAVIATGTYQVLGVVVGDAVVPWSHVIPNALGAALYAAVLAPFVIPLTQFLVRRPERTGPIPAQAIRARVSASQAAQ